MSVKTRHEGGKGRGAKSDLINFDHRNDINPLKQEVAVKKSGGLFLSPNGVKVEIPPGASTGRRERLLCATVPSSARGILGPWLGPNLRMASDMQLFYSPQNFRNPVALFIPFTCAAARELAYPSEAEESELIDTKKFKVDASMKDANEGDSVQAQEIVYGRLTKTTSRAKTTPILQLGKRSNKGPAMLDTRSVFLLSCRIGEDHWDIVENFTVIQPTVHHNQWPSELKRLSTQSTRWQDTGTQSSTTNDTQYAAKRLSGMNPRGRRAGATIGRDPDPLDQIRRIEAYCGGLCIATEELCHCYLIVIGTRAENFLVNREGGFFRSPLLHPFLSVRIPKRSCLVNKLSSFKAIEIRPNWNQAASQFDSQMMEVEGCSDIYELDLPDIILRRPAIVRIPLPQWFIERRSRSHENWDQNSVTLGSSEPQEPSSASRVGASDGTYCYDRPLMLLYQPPGHKRQIVWQVATVEDAREDSSRRKSRFQMPRKDAASSDRCKIENLFIRLGWSFLMVGIRGGQWFTVKQPLYFTKRTGFFETNALGRFVLIGARDPERTPVTRLAHLMSRVEALSVAPPGALVIFLQLQPTCWKIMAKLYPEDRLAESIQEQVASGFVPIVQMSTGPVRGSISLCNALIQATDIIQTFKDASDTQKIRKPPPVRVNGVDINHVLMYNGLALEFRLTGGEVRQKPVSQFEPLGQALKHTKHSEQDEESNRPQSTEGSSRRDFSLGLIGEKPEPVKRDVQTMLTSSARLQHHELIPETACVFEIEPIITDESKFSEKSLEKLQLVTNGLRALTKKQESMSDDYDDEGDEVDEDDDILETDADDDDDDILRRSFSSENQVPTSYDGNDGEVDEFTQEAHEQVLRNQPLSAITLNSELLRRVNNVIEKSRTSRAGEFLQKVHDIFHVGTLEVWLVAPQSLPQLAAPTKQKGPVSSDDTTDSSGGPPEHLGQSAAASAEPTDAEQPAHKMSEPDELMDDNDEESDNESVREAHNAIKWNPVDAAGADAKPDLMTNPSKPLAVYDLLIDPDLVLSYNRAPAGKSGASPAAQKKSTRGKSPGKKRAKKATKQNNANVANKEQVINELNGMSFSELDEGSFDTAEELCDVDKQTLHMLAGHIRNPKQLATALGISAEDFDKMNDPPQDTMSLAFGVLRAWRRRWNPSTEKSHLKGDIQKAETDRVRSPQKDLIDALQAVGCSEGVELIRGMKKTKDN